MNGEEIKIIKSLDPEAIQEAANGISRVMALIGELEKGVAVEEKKLQDAKDLLKKAQAELLRMREVIKILSK